MIKNLREVLKSFGFGEKTGIDLPGESRGILKKLPWGDLLLGTVSFGHGVTTTPLQMATAYGVIANGGILRRPYIVRSIVSSDSGVREDFGPETGEKSFNTGRCFNNEINAGGSHFARDDGSPG